MIYNHQLLAALVVFAFFVIVVIGGIIASGNRKQVIDEWRTSRKVRKLRKEERRLARRNKRMKNMTPKYEFLAIGSGCVVNGRLELDNIASKGVADGKVLVLALSKESEVLNVTDQHMQEHVERKATFHLERIIKKG